MHFASELRGAIVRRMVGYRRFEGLEAATLLAELYRSVRLFVNFFQPSFKLVGKERDGARVRKTYSAPATPHQRLMSDARVSDAIRARVNEISAKLDPVILLRDIRTMQERLTTLADAQPAGSPAAPSIELFLASLRTAWKDGTARPTDRPPVRAKRERRRPDPLVEVTPLLRQWFEAEPWRTGSELLAKLQVEHPGSYPNNMARRRSSGVALRFDGKHKRRPRQLAVTKLMRPVATQSRPATRPASSAPSVREQNR